MATPKQALSTNSEAANSPDHASSYRELQAEYQQRQRSPRPLPSSVAKAYEVLIASHELTQDFGQNLKRDLRQEPGQDAANAPNR